MGPVSWFLAICVICAAVILLALALSVYDYVQSRRKRDRIEQICFALGLDRELVGEYQERHEMTDAELLDDLYDLLEKELMR